MPVLADPVLETVRSLAKHEADRAELERQRQEEPDPELRQLYEAELSAADARIEAEGELLESDLLRLRLRLLPSSGGSSSSSTGAAAPDTDERNAILELAPGVGGQEAALFAGELYEMYERFTETHGWRFELEHYSEAAAGGLQAATVRISDAGGGGGGSLDGGVGAGPYGWLRFESGVHRVQRVPETEKKGRMQTSGAAVVVLPVAVETDLVLNKGDLRVDISKKSSGPGGQSVNSSYQAVRITHLPTGMSVFCASSQSQAENRVRAMEMLRTRLLDKDTSARTSFERAERKEQRGTGDRSEKIRTYNFQRDEVVDHRLGKGAVASGLGANDVVFGAGLEPLLEAHRACVRGERLEEAVELLCALSGAGPLP